MGQSVCYSSRKTTADCFCLQGNNYRLSRWPVCASVLRMLLHFPGLRCAGQDTSRQPGFQRGGDPRDVECPQHQVPEPSQSLMSRREKEGCPFQAGVPRPTQEGGTGPSTAVVVTATPARTGGVCSAAQETQGNRRVPTALTSEVTARPWEAMWGVRLSRPLWAPLFWRWY